MGIAPMRWTGTGKWICAYFSDSTTDWLYHILFAPLSVECALAICEDLGK